MRILPGPLFIFLLVSLSPFALFVSHPSWAGMMFPLLGSLLALGAVLEVIRSRTDPERVIVSVPPDIHFQQLRPAELVLSLSNTGDRPVGVVLGLDADEELGLAEPIQSRVLPPRSATDVPFAVTPVERGTVQVSAVYLESETPWRWFRRRWRVPIGRPIRIYPDIGRLAASLYSSRILKSISGARRANLSGKGREFDQLRDYLPGDAYQDIHWKATARLDRPVTNLYRIERTQSIYAVVDTSRLSRLRHAGKSNLDLVTETVLHLGIRCEREGDLFGLIHFSDQVGGFVQAESGKPHLRLLRQTVSDLQPQPVTPNYEDLMVFIRRSIRRRSFLLFFTDLSDPSLGATFTHDIQILSAKHLTAAIMFRPAWAHPLFSGRPVRRESEVVERLAGQIGMNQIDRLHQDLRRVGIDLLVTEPSRIVTDAVNAYLRVKERQLI